MAVPPYRCEGYGSLCCCSGCPTIQVWKFWFTELLQWLSHHYHTGVKVVVYFVIAVAVPPYRCESCGSLCFCSGCPTITIQVWKLWFTLLLQWSHHTGVDIVFIVAVAVPPYRCGCCGLLSCCSGCPTIQVWKLWFTVLMQRLSHHKGVDVVVYWVAVAGPPYRCESCGLLCCCSGWPTSRRWTWWCWGTPKESMLPCICRWSSTSPKRQVTMVIKNHFVNNWIILWITGLLGQLLNRFMNWWIIFWFTEFACELLDQLGISLILVSYLSGDCGRICSDTQTHCFLSVPKIWIRNI